MKNFNKRTIIVIIAALVVGILIGRIFFGGSSNQPTKDSKSVTAVADKAVWTCSMHPQIRRSKPGDCPICGMDLIPLESGSGETDPMAISMSSTAMKLANIQTLAVHSGNALKSVHLNGKVQMDERLLFTQSSHIPGRIEKLTVNFTGDFVQEGQVIAYVYSPELVNAQEELFEAHTIKATQPALFQAAKEKLKNWKLSDKQVDQILASNKIISQFPILANVSGYVTKKLVNLGDYIKLGQPIYEIADLSKVWVLFDVYESEIAWIKKGDKITYTFQSLPGESFTGNLSYIDPTINPKTRVAQARVEANNSALKLKPEMFASGIVEAKTNRAVNALIVPKTAVMWTGKRSVVYVKKSDDKGINFVMREVILGPTVGESFVIKSGLQSGEEVAVNGTFSVDAAAQLAGKPSMMDPAGGAAMTGHHHGGSPVKSGAATPVLAQKVLIGKEAKKAIKNLLTTYFTMKSALVGDDFEAAKSAGLLLKERLNGIKMAAFKGATHNVWMKHSSVLKSNLQHIQHMQSIEALRKQFVPISATVIAIAESFGPVTDETLYIQYCPMADANKGARWLSAGQEIMNPYFGGAMLTCGEVIKTL